MTVSTASGRDLLRSGAPSPLRVRRAILVAALLATTALTAPLMITRAQAQNLPTGGTVAAGTVSIGQPAATRMNIVQSSSSAIVNWQGFSIGAGSTVSITQPNASAAILNRVTGDAPSSIAGSLRANGQVYLVNPNGIAITASGKVYAGGGFVASTLGIADSDFMAGRRQFSGNGSSAAVSNAGSIRVGRGGYAALIGGTVSNAGSIEVPLGKVGLGSGEQATLDFSGDGFLQVAVPTKAGGSEALIRNSGRIRADGGSVTISAATAREAARNAVNISGLVQARSISGRSGAIVIGGGAGGKVALSGRISTASKRGNGGRITVTGKEIALAGARIDASGRTGGGAVNIGGNYQGHGPLQRADSVSIDAATTIKADAIRTGRGGEVVVWSDQLTSFAGTISACGGAESGDGGNAEVSGKAMLDYRGFADLSAANGAFGTLLLDPYNVIISNGTNNTGGSYTGNINDSVINAATLQSQLAGANVTISTGAGGSQAGDITVAAPLTWSSGSKLTLNAYHSIAVDAPVTITGAGKLELTTNNGGSGGTLSFAGGVQYTGAPHSGQSLTINGTAYTLLYSMSDLQGINNLAGMTGNYALARSLNAGATAGFVPIGIDTNGLPFFSGVSGIYGFRGAFTGLGNTITDLTINVPQTYAGLFGYSRGTISDIGLIGGSFAGRQKVGALIGYQEGGSISRSYAAGSVATNSSLIQSAGGLVGELNGGSITASYATGAVAGENNVGGLVGSVTNGTVSNSHATGTVTGFSPTSTTSAVGGLVGKLDGGGSVIASYATGAVSGDNYVGGLVGDSSSSGYVSVSYATGAVSGGNGAGGLVGRAGGFVNSTGTITASYATGAVSGFNNVGGLVGEQRYDVSSSFATGTVRGRAGGDNVTSENFGGLVGAQFGDIANSFASGAVFGNNYVGGLVGAQRGGTINAGYATGTVTMAAGTGAGALVGTHGAANNSYYDSGTTGRSGEAVGTAMTTAQLQSGVLPVGFDPAIWGTGANLYPYLKSIFPGGVQVVSGFAYKSDGTPLPTGRYEGAPTVNIASNGTVIGRASTGANGYYYFFAAPNTITSPNGVAAFTTADAQLGTTNAVAFRSGVPTGLTTGLDIWGDARTDITSLTSLTQLQAQSDGAYLATVAGTPVAGLTFAGRGIVASGAFTIDGLLQASGTVSVTAGGNLTIASNGTVSGNRVTLATGGAFVNQSGADAINAATRWLVYADGPSGNIFGGLDSGNVAVWNTKANAPIAETGNRYVFAYRPTLTFTTTDETKTYGQAKLVGDSYTVSAGIASVDVAGAYRGISLADAYQGRPLVSSGGSAVDAGVAGSPYTILISGGTVSSPKGYALAFVSSGRLTVDPATLIVSVNDAAKTYDGLAFTGGNGVNYVGFVNGETAGALGGTLAYLGTAQNAVNAGSYTLTAGGLTSNNYNIVYTTGALTITPTPLIVSVNNAAKTYDGLTFGGGNGVSYFGFVNGETTAALGGTLAYLGNSQNAVNAGSYSLTAGGLSSGNYNILYTTGTLTVTPAALTVAVNNGTKIYDGQAFTGGVGLTYSGLVNDETASVLGGTLVYGGSAQGAIGTGSYEVTAGGYSSSNYLISYRPGTLTVIPAPLTVTANSADKFYDGKAYSGGNGATYMGFVNGETVSVLDGALVYGGSAQGAVDAGSYEITVGGYTSKNYALRFVPGTLTVKLVPSSDDTAGGLVRDQFFSLVLPWQANPPAGGPPMLDASGAGQLYADPRSEQICFGGAIALCAAAPSGTAS